VAATNVHRTLGLLSGRGYQPVGGRALPRPSDQSSRCAGELFLLVHRGWSVARDHRHANCLQRARPLACQTRGRPI